MFPTQLYVEMFWLRNMTTDDAEASRILRNAHEKHHLWPLASRHAAATRRVNPPGETADDPNHH